MEFERPNFVDGHPLLREKMNNLTRDIFRAINIRTDRFISQTKSPTGMALGLNLEELRQHLAIKRGGGGGGPVTIAWAKIIEQPQYGDPENFLLPNGRSYYTLRLTTSDYPIYAAGTSYVDDSLVVFPDADGRVYKSKGGTGTPPVQSGHQPDTSPDYWTVQEELKVEYALGDKRFDLRRYTPWFPVGQTVPIIQDASAVWYIWAAMTYGGEDDEASLRWNSEDGRAMACYS